MGQECQKCQSSQEPRVNEVVHKDQFSSDSDPEYEENDEKYPCKTNTIQEKPPSLDSKSNSSTFIKEHYDASSPIQLIFEDGAVYTGEIWKGKANGQGRLLQPNGDVLEGKFENNLLCGEGKCKYAKGPTYVGQFYNNKPNGMGKETWPDGSVYEGEFKNGKKHGKGLYKWSQQSVYEGEWSDNMINGYGKYDWPDGRSYQGCWVRNQMHGRGNYKWKDGKYYDGEYEYDKKSGFGIFHWPDGKQYQGYWRDGKQHGRGLMINKEGKKKFGEWSDGKLVRCSDDNDQQLIPDGWFLNNQQSQ